MKNNQRNKKNIREFLSRCKDCDEYDFVYDSNLCLVCTHGKDVKKWNI